MVIEFIAVGVLGGLVATGELVARYKDSPTDALMSVPAFTYLAVNAAASVAALWLAQVFGWTFGGEPGSEAARVTQVLVAGFGALAFFRSSLFMVRVGDDDVGVGPIAFLQVILAACDRAVDRNRAVDRALLVSKVMQGLTFRSVEQSLPTYAAAMLQNLSREDQQDLGDQVKQLRESPMSNQLKVFALGLLLMNFVGEDVLAAAADAIRRETAGGQAPDAGGAGLLGRIRSGGRGRDRAADEEPPAGADPAGVGPAPGAAPPGTAIGADSDPT